MPVVTPIPQLIGVVDGVGSGVLVFVGVAVKVVVGVGDLVGVCVAVKVVVDVGVTHGKVPHELP